MDQNKQQEPCLLVAKVGGSLFGFKKLYPQITAWAFQNQNVLDQQLNQILLITGGGQEVETLRKSELSDEEAHWKAIEIMNRSARLFYEGWLKYQTTTREADFFSLTLSSKISLNPPSPTRLQITVFQPGQFLRETEPSSPGKKLPYQWSVTSDSILVRLGKITDANKIVLLKSSAPSQNESFEELTQRGYIDPFLKELLPTSPPVYWVDLRNQEQTSSFLCTPQNRLTV